METTAPTGATPEPTPTPRPAAGPDEIDLDFPMPIGGKTVDRITMRRPKVRDRLVADQAEGGDAAKEARLIGNITNISPDELEEMDLKDYRKLQAKLSSFIDPQSQT